MIYYYLSGTNIIWFYVLFVAILSFKSFFKQIILESYLFKCLL